MKVILSGPANNANCKSVAKGLVDQHLLAKYYTSIAVFPKSTLDRLGGINMFSEIRRKRFDPLLKNYIKTAPFWEAGRMFSNKFGLHNLTKPDNSIFSIESINHKHDKRVASSLVKAKKNGVKAVFCYEDVASMTFKEAKNLGLRNFYELPIGYWRSAHKLLKSEQEQWPEWANTITGFNDSEEKLKRKDEEIALADKIFVASSFTAKTLEEYPCKLPPIELIPYGFPPVIQESMQNLSFDRNRNRVLRLLFVGGLSQRKGIANLFAAVEDLKPYVELTIIGHKPNVDCKPLDMALSKHHWIPTLSNNKVLELMREHDVLVFPSLFEGFGLVITEAMSQGTPVITTDRTAGKEFITHDKNGWLVEAGSTLALKQQIERLIDNREIIEDVSRNALITAKNRPWSIYSNEIANSVKNELTY
ncbi:glycosyltransferase family 4 protein [Mariniflexile fucanivorans]|nr:glycosyltransferase family 4 protein [Mariniflexile fucanivorans]